ncbi:hypothetical protein [Sphingomonas sp. PR090111-T3T-6A]|uniref:hypothetical protein n=1 Tax=Sphingomonas sp. PR090111-T3T-6A TaxID=685778 RepID=UPI0012F9C815|nr:hypothetical protein [Sphingomonas sp. PR090111-T3T-6A]
MSVAGGPLLEGAENGEKNLERAWPDGLSMADRVLWDTLPSDRRDAAMRRLTAILDYEDRTDDTPDLAACAKAAGVAKVTFYQLLAAWRRHRSIAVVVPFGRSMTPQGARIANLREVRTAIGRLLAENPEHSDEAIARMAKRTLSDGPGITTLRKLVRERRIEEKRDLSAFGTALLIDHVATDMRLAMDGRSEQAVACLVVDAGTGLILGGRCGPWDDQWAIRLLSVIAARDLLEGGGAEAGSTRAGLETTIVVGPGFDPKERIADEALAETPIAEVIAEGDRRFGARVLRILGRRIGHIRLLPRLTAKGEAPTTAFATRQAVATRPKSLEEADAHFGAEIARHNAALLGPESLPKLAAEHASRAGALLQVLDELQAYWRGVYENR